MKNFKLWFGCVLVILNEISLFAVLCFITDPQVRDLSNGHNTIGNTVTLECTVGSNKPHVAVQWMAPLNFNLTNRVSITSKTENFTSAFYVIKSFYAIKDFRFEDQSVYYCASVEPDNPFDRKYRYIFVTVYDPGENLIEFHRYLTTFDQSNAEIQVHIRAHPEATFYWMDNKNKTIDSNSRRFQVDTKHSSDFTNYKSILKFNEISEEDFGNYTVIAENKYEKKNYTVSINVTGLPSTSIKVISTDQDSVIVKCDSVAYPKPNITWQFEECRGLSCFRNISLSNTINISTKKGFRSEDNGLQSVSYIAVNDSNLGFLRGVGTNSFGQNSSLQHIYKANGLELYSETMFKNGSLLKLETLFHENVEIICAVSLDDYYHEIKWWKDGKRYSLGDVRVAIKGFDEYKIRNIDAIYSSVSVLRMSIDKIDEGNYTCKASKKDGRIDSKLFTIIARELPVLNVASNMQNQTTIVKFGGSWKFYCNVDGFPTPRINWYKNNVTINSTDRVNVKDKNQTLAITDIGPSDNGTYKCEVSNRLNQTIIKTANLGAIPAEFDWLLVVIIILVCSLVLVTIFILIKVKKENKLKKELEALGLANFEEGAIESLNPDLRLDDQAELLPYDKKWEIPSENLSLGKELGSGAFGVVVKGELNGFPNKNSSTTVAVKMVNKFAGDDCIKALASELKIMVHLGQHINIVNLIGACTQDITKKKLLVVVEFCAFGSLHEHILYNTNNFVDQRRESLDRFDWTIKPKSLEEEYKPKKEKNTTPKLQYTTLSFSSSGSSESSDYESQNTSKKNSEEIRKCMCSQDFLVWSFQIARGMEYLTSRRVLHGDLAARNVLLAEDNIVKISDFGLSRSMYKNGIYKKKAHGPLPVKWMALESIGENIFSSQSDVWSFGVTLWELFSLCKTPYPGIPFDQAFYNKLQSGYRMDKPEFATTKIYEIMLDCWNASPVERPSFTELADRIGSILEEPVRAHYMDMNGPYITMNSLNIEKEKKDYLLLMGKPDFESVVPSAPHYANNINYFQTATANMGYINDKTDNIE